MTLQWCCFTIFEVDLSRLSPLYYNIATLLHRLLDIFQCKSARHINGSVEINVTLGIFRLLNKPIFSHNNEALWSPELDVSTQVENFVPRLLGISYLQSDRCDAQKI